MIQPLASSEGVHIDDFRRIPEILVFSLRQGLDTIVFSFLSECGLPRSGTTWLRVIRLKIRRSTTLLGGIHVHRHEDLRMLSVPVSTRGRLKVNVDDKGLTTGSDIARVHFMLDAKVWWPLFPLLLLVVIVSLTWALVIVARGKRDPAAIWLQVGAFSAYILAAASAIASERGLVSANLHRPFSIATQLCLLAALIYHWRGSRPSLRWLNSLAWAGILSDGALHYLMVRH